jgi:hypothetical protein
MLGIRDQTGTDPFAGGRLILGLSFQSVSPGLSRIPDPPVRNNSETDEEDCAFRIRLSPNVCRRVCGMFSSLEIHLAFSRGIALPARSKPDIRLTSQPVVRPTNIDQ